MIEEPSARLGNDAQCDITGSSTGVVKAVAAPFERHMTNLTPRAQMMRESLHSP